MSASNSSSPSYSSSPSQREGIRLAVVGSRNYSQEFEEYIFEKLDLFLDCKMCNPCPHNRLKRNCKECKKSSMTRKKKRMRRKVKRRTRKKTLVES